MEGNICTCSGLFCLDQKITTSNEYTTVALTRSGELLAVASDYGLDIFKKEDEIYNLFQHI